jgi:hypothetical protein
VKFIAAIKVRQIFSPPLGSGIRDPESAIGNKAGSGIGDPGKHPESAPLLWVLI